MSDQVWVTDNLNNTGSSGWSNAYLSAYVSRLVNVVTDVTAPSGSNNVLQFSYPVGHQAGSAPSTIFHTLKSLNEMYVGFWWKPSNPWQDETGSHVNKLFFLMGSGSNDQMTIQMMGPPPYSMAVALEFDADNSHLANVTCGSSPGTCIAYGNVARPNVALGRWHRLELRVKRSTSRTSKDGIVQWWMDGTLIGNYTTVSFPTGVWIEAQFSPTWGGRNNTKTQQDYYWFNHAYMSRK